MNIYTKKPFGSAWNKQSFLGKRILIGFIILALLITFLNIFQSQVRNSFYFISNPITKSFWQTGKNVSGFLESFFNARNIKQENSNLLQENQKLLSEVYLLQESLRRNQILKEALDLAKENNFAIQSVQVIGLDLPNDFILINKGSEGGILENMPVISNQKVLYGRVFKVYKNFSQVMLLSNKNSALAVKISQLQIDQELSTESQQNNDLIKIPIHGVIRGGNDAFLYLDLVDSESEIKEEDILVSSALEGIFPKDLLIGKIIAKTKNDLKPFQTAMVQPFFDVRKIDNLFVITDYMRK